MLILGGYPDTKTTQRYDKKENYSPISLITDEHRCKTPQQNTTTY